MFIILIKCKSTCFIEQIVKAAPWDSLNLKHGDRVYASESDVYRRDE